MQGLWIVLTVLIAVGVGWPVTLGMLRLARAAEVLDAQEPPAAAEPTNRTDGPPAAAPARPSPGVLRGGLVIGMLERAAVVVAILADQPVAIAYVVAIKGLGRYPELRQSPAASERFIIGTLSSMLWAAAVAVLVKWLLPGS
ncbi:hypothetical protein IV500_07625 [Paeniglutamicibacter antarcticus]|uniref:Uncharacterized protein n=1 Tax=Arthrobacter terrae TaxID=2935737 RepID=A0A931G4W0_9MICC|nr:hypothetical protein [Arthrobacter terrae]MBG0739258.1 hypothetical protein [Arthrobacter terrae]